MEWEIIFSIVNIVESLWLILPAYAANGLVPIIGKKLSVRPIDGGRNFIDGRPLFGNGKSWEGLIFGSLIGGIIGLTEQIAFPYLPWYLSEVPLTIVPMSFFFGLTIGFGAMIGDIIGSFIKRRANLKRGQTAPLLDQEDFLLGSLLFTSLFATIKIEWIILLLIITPMFHFFANIVAYMIKVKKEPY